MGKFLGLKQAMKGGVGSICLVAREGFRVGALVAVNALGNVFDSAPGRTIAGARHPLSSGFLEFAEVIEKGLPVVSQPGQNTTLRVIVTDAVVDSLLLTKIAQAGHLGLAQAVQPVHTSFDGDTFFAVATAQPALPSSSPSFSADAVVHFASEAVRLAILRAVQAGRSVAEISGLAG